jgi:Tfp pilus assembly protein PilO
MKLQMSSNNRLIAAILVVVALAVAFWMMLLSPKREEAKKLGAQVEQLEASLAQHEAEVAEAEAAREEFPTQYQRLVVLGKAVPGDDDVASLLVQLNRISDAADGTFREMKLSASGGGAEAPAAPAAPAGAEGTPVSATEVAASLLPLGAAIGPAGLAVMPYEVSFDGSFFDVADFIKGLDSLVRTGDDEVSVDGRLVTVDSFTLEADPNEGFPALQASFSLTTYLTPPSEGATGGATPETPGATTVTPAATTTGGAP